MKKKTRMEGDDEKSLHEAARALGIVCAQICNRTLDALCKPPAPKNEEECEAAKGELSAEIRQALHQKLTGEPPGVVAYLCADVMKTQLMRAIHDRVTEIELKKQLGPLMEAIQGAVPGAFVRTRGDGEEGDSKSQP